MKHLCLAPTQSETHNICEKTLITKDIVVKSKPGVVTLLTKDSQGSGFVISNHSGISYILTNQHVVKEANEVKIIWADGKENAGNVVINGDANSTLKDIAIVKSRDKKTVVLPIQKRLLAIRRNS